MTVVEEQTGRIERAGLAAPGEWGAGWGVVLAATVGIAVAGVHYHVVGALVKPLGDAYGWSRGEVAMALTIASCLSPFTNVAVGLLADRFGPRPVMLIGIPLFGVSFALLGLAGPLLWTWYAGYAAFAIIGHGMSPVVWTMVVVRQFERHRGLALAIALSGTGVLVSLIPSIVLALTNWAGLRGAFLALGGAGAVLAFIPALLFIPRGRGQAMRPEQSGEAGGATAREALLHTRFWRMAAAFLAVSTCVGVFIVHFQPMLTDSGMAPAQAAQVALALGPTMIVGRLFTGWLFDRFDLRAVAAGAFFMPAIACVMLLAMDGGFALAVATAVVIGLGMGAEVDVLAYLTSRYFGLRRYGVLFGILLGLYGVGVGAGSWIAGVVFDAAGTYDPLLWTLSFLVVGAAGLGATLGAAQYGAKKPHQ